MDACMDTRLVFVHALSPLHAGTGQGIGIIDLPIAREKATGIPFLPGSSLKGSLRDLCQDKEKQKVIFGPDKNPEEHSGAAQFSDQRLLLLPIRSLVGTFAWATSPYILQRFVREAKLAGFNNLPPIPKPLKETDCVITKTCRLEYPNPKKIFLEDLDLDPSDKQEDKTKATCWADWLAPRLFPEEPDWQAMLKERFCIVHDDLLSFLLETATEVSARIVLKDDTKTADNLWYEETLPVETVLSGLILAKPPLMFTKDSLPQNDRLTATEIFNDLKGLITRAGAVQLGGKATVGHGLCTIKIVDPLANVKVGECNVNT